MTEEVRTVAGLTSGEWAVGVWALVVIVICLQELSRALASLAAVHDTEEGSRDRPSSLPLHRLASHAELAPVTARRQEVNHARRGAWDR